MIRSLFTRVALAVAVSLAGLAWPSIGRAVTVSPGYDLLTTQPGTTFAGAAFQGVPLNTFDFGGSIGVKNVGSTDTIIQRLASANGPTPQEIAIQMLALQLVSVSPINLGAGLGLYFITLQSARGGSASTGRMTINFTPQTFDSFFDVFFDLRFEDLNGPIVQSTSLRLSSSGVPWSNLAPPGSLLIDGVNNLLNGSNNNNDFWPIGLIIETHPEGAQHVASSTTVPDSGSTFTLLGLTLIGIAGFLGKFGGLKSGAKRLIGEARSTPKTAHRFLWDLAPRSTDILWHPCRKNRLSASPSAFAVAPSHPPK